MTSLSNTARTFFLVRPDRLGDLVIEKKTMPEGMIDIIGFNFNPVKNQFDTTVSSSTWEVESGTGSVTIASSSNTAISTQTTATAASEGIARLKNTVTMSDSQVIVRWVEVKVTKSRVGKDYPSF